MSKRFEQVKRLYKQSLAGELISFAGEKEDLEELKKELMNEKEEEKLNKPIKPVKPTEIKKFVSPEELAKELGGKEIKLPEKKEPVLPHRIQERTLRTDLPKEMPSSRMTPGTHMGKICNVCGSFNPYRATECSTCKKYYKFIKKLVEEEGLSADQAINYILANKIPEIEELAGIVINPEKLSSRRKIFLGKPQLQEIWRKGGSIHLPKEAINLEQEFETEKGFRGVPNYIKIRDILENELNVEKQKKEIFDDKTGQTIEVEDVYFDENGMPVPLKKKEYFTLNELLNKLKLDDASFLKTITDYNIANKKNIKPSAFVDDKNQAFKWSEIEPVFKEQLKKVYNDEKNLYLSSLVSKMKKAEEIIKSLQGSLQMALNKKDTAISEIKNHPNKTELGELYKARMKEKSIRKELNDVRADISKSPNLNLKEKEKVLIEELSSVNEEAGKLEGPYGKTLDRLLKPYNEAEMSISDINKKIERNTKLIPKIKEKGEEFLQAIISVEPSLEALDNIKIKEGILENELKELASELMSEKKSNRIFFMNYFLKLAKEPEQLGLPLAPIKKKPLGEFENIPIIEVEKILQKQNPNWKSKSIKDIIKEVVTSAKITEEEALNLLKEMAYPTYKSQRPKEILEPEKKEEVKYEERTCPKCGKKKILSGKCQECGFTSAENLKQIAVEHIIWRLLYDKDGNPIPKLDADGNQEYDDNGNPKFKKRPEKQLALVSIQLDEMGLPKWATAQKISAHTQEIGAKTPEEKQEFYKRTEGLPPRVRELKPLTKNPEDFRSIYKLIINEKGEEERVPTGEKEHKQKCKECPEPWVKVKPENFGSYEPIEQAIKFMKGEELDKNFKAWNYKDVYQPPKPEFESEKGKFEQNRILPTARDRMERILKLALLMK